MTGSTSANSSIPSFPEAQALALWTFVHSRVPRFTSQSALEVVKSLTPTVTESPQRLAWRLRRELAVRGVHLKHAHALEAASRLLGHKSWHAARTSAPPTAILRVNGLSDAGELLLNSWDELAPHLRSICKIGLEESRSRLMRVRCETRSLTVNVSIKVREEQDQDLTWLPVLIVTPVQDDPKWLEGAATALESVRRHLEESGTAILDGITVIQLCSRRLPAGNVLMPDPVHPTDAGNAELILLREDNELDPGSRYEIARGDELLCWSQLEMAEEKRELQVRIDDETGAWHIGRARYVWEFATLRPKEYVPGLIVSNLTVQESRKLLHRYRLAKRIDANRLTLQETAKSLEYLGAPDECYRVDLHRLLRAMKDTGLTWESYCERAGITQRMESQLPLSFILSLLQELNLPNPNVIWARPTEGELHRVDDDTLLRALVPRIHHVTYRLPPGFNAERNEQVKEAIAEFSTSMALEKQIGIKLQEPLPHLVYAGDSEELRMKLQDLGLELWAGVIPHLLKTDGVIEKLPAVVPFAFGFSLYLDIRVRDDNR